MIYKLAIHKNAIIKKLTFQRIREFTQTEKGVMHISLIWSDIEMQIFSPPLKLIINMQPAYYIHMYEYIFKYIEDNAIFVKLIIVRDVL